MNDTVSQRLCTADGPMHHVKIGDRLFIISVAKNDWSFYRDVY